MIISLLWSRKPSDYFTEHIHTLLRNVWFKGTPYFFKSSTVFMKPFQMTWTRISQWQAVFHHNHKSELSSFAVKLSDHVLIIRITNSRLCLFKVKYLNILTELWEGSALCDWSIKVWKGKDCLAERSLTLPLLRTGISRGSPSTHPPHPYPATDRGEGANNSSSV
jgi:hypothetical protein